MTEDLYRLDTGASPFRLRDGFGNTFEVEYLRSGMITRVAKDRIVPYENEEGAKDMTKVLYQLADTEMYCYRIATDSQGRAVIEIKGTNEIRAVDPKDLVEVLPYSVGIQFAGGSTVYHYWATPGELAVGDMLIGGNDGASIALVKEIDTKSRRADKRFAGWKVNATRLADE